MANWSDKYLLNINIRQIPYIEIWWELWELLCSGVFEAATIHYVVAKIFGPLLFGRGWCGYACWTAMVLDFLPYKKPQAARKKIGFIRYITFAFSFLFVVMLFLNHVGNMEKIMFIAFIVGNILYYIVGIILAFRLKDNRAFCKYICPVTIFLKPMSYFSVVRVKCDKEKCISCGKCKKVCPMNVDITDNSRKRKNGTECILCMECVRTCPRKVLWAEFPAGCTLVSAVTENETNSSVRPMLNIVKPQ